MTGRSRRIRVPGVPGDFRVPPGWPTPTDRWVRENVFWDPPADWRPLAGLRPAPPGWLFWEPNAMFMRLEAEHFRPIAVWSRLSAGLLVLWIVALIADQLLGYPLALRAVALTAVLGALVCRGIHAILQSLIRQGLTAEFAFVADRARTERMSIEYVRYRLAVA